MRMLLEDINSSFLSLGYNELAIPIGFLLWLFIVMMSLKKADPQSWIQGWMYSGFIVFAGFILVLAIPQKYLPHLSIQKTAFWFTVFWSISFGRWSLALAQIRYFPKNQNKKKK